MMLRKLIITTLLLASWSTAATVVAASDTGTTTPWTVEKANAWYADQPWLAGSNYIPAYAINQLEMWQADTFDLAAIDREFQWAEDLGFNSMRVFLHHLLWEQDKEGFLERIDQFLDVAAKHNIGIMFVLFDSCWDPHPKLGEQRDPKPGLHNSGWVQSPGAAVLGDAAKFAEMKDYVVGVISHFKNDKRVQIWDLWNEPDNPVRKYKDVELPNKKELIPGYLQQTYEWARSASPTQPLTSGVWVGRFPSDSDLTPTERVQIDNSDVISFHSYEPLDKVKITANNLKRYKRPLLCTEYMARTIDSTFDPVMGYFKQEKIGAYNWGFVSGKSQTIFPWDSWEKHYDKEPPLWFHDILRPDGSPYKQEEADYIKSLTGSEDSATTDSGS